MRRLTMVAAGAALLAVAGCADPADPGAGGPPAEATAVGVVPLAKVEGWRPGLDAGSPYALLEIAYDRTVAEQAWADNVPADLPAGGDSLEQPGRFGDLEQVDFDQQALVVWSSGESSSCPGWLADLRTVDGVVEIVPGVSGPTEPADGEPMIACTSDYNPYRVVLAVDRDRVPDPADLPIEQVTGVPDALVSSYPAG